MPGPNGEPSGMSAGVWAVTRALQHGHVARNRLIRVVIGLIGGRSTWSQALANSWPASSSAAAHAQRAAEELRRAAGFSASARAAPGRPLRSFFTLVGSATFPF